MDKKIKILEEIYAHIVKHGKGPNARQFLVAHYDRKGIVDELARDRYLKVDDYGRYVLQARHLKHAGPWKKDMVLADKIIACLSKILQRNSDKVVAAEDISVEAKTAEVQRALGYLSDLGHISVEKQKIKDGVRSIDSFRLLLKIVYCPTVESGLKDYEKQIAEQFLPSVELTSEVKSDKADSREKSNDDGANVVYRLSYNDMTLKLKISGPFKNKDGALLKRSVELASPHLDGENDIVIGFLNKNPNRSFSKAELEKQITKMRREKFVLRKPLFKIPEKLGFTGELSMFLKGGVRGIRLKNPITRKDLDLAGIDYLSIPS
jgi:hypothetical protein